MKPVAAPPVFPYPDHRTMAEVIADEQRKRDEMSLRQVSGNRKRVA